MMIVSDNSANVEFTEYEFEILSCITSERIDSMNSRLKECDSYKYIDICQLNAKLESISTLIKHEKKMLTERKLAKKATDEIIQRLKESETEDDEDDNWDDNDWA